LENVVVKILILGGYGVFGGRLAELLCDIATLEILICGRNLDHATKFCSDYQGRAIVRPLQLDRKDIAKSLLAEQPDLVVDASGPFQNYGDNGYGVIAACIANGINYLDFADAADFVFGVSRFDEDAKKAGIFVLSGVSSFPVLTAAVLRVMAEEIDIVSVHGGIAPSPYAGIGLNVMRAVVGYAGAPVKLQRGGVQSYAMGLAESMRYTIAAPGKVPLKNIHFSLVDVPDLQVIPPEHASLTDIWIGAGPVPEVLHRLLNLLAKARAQFRLPSLVPFSRLFYTVLNLMKFGEHRGGMFVHAKGRNDGKDVALSWHLLAEGDDGPYIPSMAIEGIIRKLLAGKSPITGARAGTHALELSDYDTLFKGRSIYTGFREKDPELPLYRQLLGSAFTHLPLQVQALHNVSEWRCWVGTADVKRGSGMLANIINWIIGFPKDASQIPVKVTFAPESNGENWIRNFGGKTFSSFQTLGTGKNDYLLIEKFGVLSIAVALVVEEDRLFLIPRRWSCLGIPLPKILLPSGKTFETEKDGQFCFDVEISAPIIGLIVAYKGKLKPT
jgi:Domain of unknown function (DUF4166)/Saccharopine dehydrogenase NADP binding domain